MKKLIFCLSGLLFSLSPFAMGANEEVLLKELRKRGVGQFIDLDLVNDLLKNADISYVDSSGANAILTISETTAYLSTGSTNKDPAALEMALAAAKSVLSKNPNVSSADGRGLSPLYYLLWYGNFQKVKPLVEDLLKSGASLEEKVIQGSVLSVAIRRLPRATVNEILTYVKDFEALLRTQADFSGMATSHIAARYAATDDKNYFFLKDLLEKIPEEKRNGVVNLKNHRGQSAFHHSIASGNLTLVKYLFETYSTDLAQKDSLEETFVDYAMRLKKNDIAEYLKTKGVPSSNPPTDISCIGANVGKLSFSDLENLIEKCKEKIKKPYDLIKLWPLTTRGQYSLFYKSGGFQPATFDAPRVIFKAGDRGDLILTSGGESNSIEILRFDRAKSRYELREITFSADGPVVSKPNPGHCTSCHGTDPNPIWASWVLWPGMYRGDSDGLFDYLKPKFHNYLKAKEDKSSIYSLLVGNEPQAGLSEMDPLIRIFGAQKAAHQLANEPKVQKFRYALVGVLSCKLHPKDFFPMDVYEALKDKYEFFTEDTLKLYGEEFNDRVNLQREFVPGSAISRYVKDVLEKAFSGGTNHVQTIDYDRVAAIRLILENVISRQFSETLFVSFSPKKNYFFSGSMTTWEMQVWQKLLSPVEDKELYEAFAEKYKALNGADEVFDWIYDSDLDFQSKICPQLVQKSVDILGGN